MKYAVIGLLLALLIVPMTINIDEVNSVTEINLDLIVEPEDINCVAWALWDEARGEPVEGQRAVLDVILTRMVKYDMTACQVVKQPNQFSGYHPSVGIHVTKDMLTVYETVSKMRPVAEDAEFFHANYVHPSWRTKLDKVVEIGHHLFYRHKQ